MTATRAWLLGLLALGACVGRCAPSYLAELIDQHGEVQRDVAVAVGAWRAAPAGTQFQVGDGLRTGPDGSAKLALSPEGVALVEPNTILRFLDRDPRGGEQRMAVQAGSLQVESGKLEIDVHTPRGFARLEQSTRVRIVTTSDHALRLDVLVGRVAVDEDGHARALSAGDKIDLAPRASDGSKPGDAVTPDASETPADVADGGVDAAVDAAIAASPPSPAAPRSVALPALESATLHTRTLPVRVRVGALPPCPVAHVLELDGRVQPRDDDAPTLALSSFGAHRLRVRCQRRVLGTSVLRLSPDSALREQPRRVQHVDVGADGRRYTVRYQNVVPVVHVAWSAAQPAASYTLFLRRGKSERRMRAETPRRDFASGELVEGRYEFWFTSASGQRSEVSTLRIELDESARALTLTEPLDGSAAEDEAAVSGVALLRSSVSANGVPLPLDDKGHFSGSVPVGRPKIVLVRAQHPAAGVHYYLRSLR